MSEDFAALFARAGGKQHEFVMRGDQARRGAYDRWCATCICGARSKRRDLTIEQAFAWFSRHEIKAGGGA